MSFSPVIDDLIGTLCYLPGVGPRTAQRMALDLLARNRDKGMELSRALERAMSRVGHCQRCRTFSETELCSICSNPRRQEKRICVVESPADMLAIEQSGGFSGRYFVLMGHLSPIDGIGPEEIGVAKLLRQVESADCEEVIIATNLTVEGEATAFYIAEALDGKAVAVTRIAHGVPLGGELGVVDGGTLSHALQGRKPVDIG